MTTVEDAALHVDAQLLQPRHIGFVLVCGVPGIRGAPAEEHRREGMQRDREIGGHVGRQDNQAVGAKMRGRAVGHRAAL